MELGNRNQCSPHVRESMTASTLWILDSGFPKGLDSSFFFLLDYGFQSLAVFRIPKPRILDFRNEKFVYSGIRIPLNGAKTPMRAKNGRKRTHVVLKTSVTGQILRPQLQCFTSFVGLNFSTLPSPAANSLYFRWPPCVELGILLTVTHRLNYMSYILTHFDYCSPLLRKVPTN